MPVQFGKLLPNPSICRLRERTHIGADAQYEPIEADSVPGGKYDATGVALDPENFQAIFSADTYTAIIKLTGDIENPDELEVKMTEIFTPLGAKLQRIELGQRPIALARAASGIRTEMLEDAVALWQQAREFENGSSFQALG